MQQQLLQLLLLAAGFVVELLLLLAVGFVLKLLLAAGVVLQLALAAGPLFLLVLMPFHRFDPLPHLRQRAISGRGCTADGCRRDKPLSRRDRGEARRQKVVIARGREVVPPRIQPLNVGVGSHGEVVLRNRWAEADAPRGRARRR